jgi:RNA-directed DNA polymerase
MAITVKKVGVVLDMDIQGFYDHTDPSWLMRFLEHRIADRRTLELIEITLQPESSTTAGGSQASRESQKGQ